MGVIFFEAMHYTALHQILNRIFGLKYKKIYLAVNANIERDVFLLCATLVLEHELLNQLSDLQYKARAAHGTNT